MSAGNQIVKDTVLMSGRLFYLIMILACLLGAAVAIRKAIQEKPIEKQQQKISQALWGRV